LFIKLIYLVNVIMYQDILIFVLFLILLTLSYNLLVDKPYYETLHGTRRSEPHFHYRNNIVYNTNDYPALFVTQPYVFITDSSVIATTPPPKNDLVNKVQTTDRYSNIVYKQSNLGDACKSSNDCDYGLICTGGVGGGGNYTCKRKIPTIKCDSNACRTLQNNGISNLGETCGGNTVNVYGNTCNTTGNLYCVSDKLISTSSGVCLNKV